ncbi:MAG TPA: Tm-1-like ATP-binding domain-containing protein, partial [Planctomycetaceae bacterium]|nr:Tm-1-like ATP-binding domain-containing protein [Planctomycetaceae bacterium]
PYVGIKDLVLIPSIVDVAGVNRISRIIFTRAAGAICGMVEAVPEEAPTDKPVIAASMFGNTTECVGMCREQLEQAGYEVLTFHAVGTGGRMLESLVTAGFIDGVLDITTTEWADELCGGVFSAGTDRLSAPGRAGVPHLIVPGCIDMVNFGPLSSVPENYRNSGRTFYEWNPDVTLMRTSAEENRELGRIFAEKANASPRPVSFLIPTRGFSILGGDGERFCDRAADRAFLEALESSLQERHRVLVMETNINSPAFAEKAVEMLREMMSGKKPV